MSRIVFLARLSAILTADGCMSSFSAISSKLMPSTSRICIICCCCGVRRLLIIASTRASIASRVIASAELSSALSPVSRFSSMLTVYARAFFRSVSMQILWMVVTLSASASLLLAIRSLRCHSRQNASYSASSASSVLPSMPAASPLSLCRKFTNTDVSKSSRSIRSLCSVCRH